MAIGFFLMKWHKTYVINSPSQDYTQLSNHAGYHHHTYTMQIELLLSGI